MNLHYLIQQNLIWIAGLLIYDLYLNRFNNFNLSRIFLLLILVIGIFIPLIDFNFSFEEVQHYTVQLGSTPIEYNSSGTQESINIKIWNWMEIIYWIGVGLSTLILVFRFVHLFNLIRFSSKEKLANQVHVFNGNIQAPFSFFHYVFLPKALKDNSESKKIIISHESAHHAKFHSLDILILEISKIFFWYNPLVYMLKKRIQLVHEFEADQVTTEQIAQEQYIDSLISFNSTIRYSSIVHPFSSQIKKRIIMIQQSFYRLTMGQILLSSIIVFITIMSIHQCAPSLTTIDKPKHYSVVDTMEIFDSETLKSDVKIVKSEYDYYTNIPELPYIKSCKSKILKEQNQCTKSTIINNIKNDPKVIAEFNKTNQNVSTDLILIIFENPNTDWPEIRIGNCEENLDVAIRNSFYNQKYEFMPGKVNGAPVIVHLKIPFTWKK